MEHYQTTFKENLNLQKNIQKIVHEKSSHSKTRDTLAVLDEE